MKKLLIGVAALFALVGALLLSLPTILHEAGLPSDTWALLLSLPTILHEAGLPSDTSIAPMGLF
jgi:hypothetical protein